MDTFADDAFHAVFSVAQWEEGVGLCLAFLSSCFSSTSQVKEVAVKICRASEGASMGTRF